MMPRYRTLAQRIQMEVEELDRTQAAIQRHWQAARVRRAGCVYRA